MKIEQTKEVLIKDIADIKPYENNPRKNDKAVEAVANSIKEFGFKNPIIIDSENVIIAGHTRYKAAKRLRLKTVPVIIANDLTPEQVKAFRIADNRVSEIATWDFDLLDIELENIDIDMSKFEADTGANFFDSDFEDEEENQDQDYKDFVEKFKPKKTTDDCYTPAEVYDAVVEWVAKEYDLDPSNFVRPFYPGGDYQNENYASSDVVVDNPPFSILAEIIDFYRENNIKFFLFAPGLTIFAYMNRGDVCAITTYNDIVYKNNVNVRTAFLTNMDENIIRSAPDLRKKIDDVNKNETSHLPRYEYPIQVLTSPMVGRLSQYGVDFKLKKDQIHLIRKFENHDIAIFGGGVLLSNKATEQKEKAEKQADNIKQKNIKQENIKIVKIELSEHEKEIIKNLE